MPNEVKQPYSLPVLVFCHYNPIVGQWEPCPQEDKVFSEYLVLAHFPHKVDHTKGSCQRGYKTELRPMFFVDNP
jgi:hypothetical protein